MFAKLCGNDALRNVVFATTAWGDPRPGEGEARQRDLDKVPKEMLERGSKTCRFNGTFESAWGVIDALPTKSIGALLIQEELVTLNRPLHETQAGICLLTHKMERHAQAISDHIAKNSKRFAVFHSLYPVLPLSV
jgi:hypothetical protein